jgi:hypothetical protein
LHIVGIAVAYCLTCIAELNDNSFRQHTDRIPDIIAIAKSITWYKVKVSMACSFTCVGKLKKFTIRSEHANRIPYFRANTTGITRHIITEAGTLCITPVVKFDDIAGWRGYTNGIIDFRAPKWTRTIKGITREVICISVTFGITGIRELQCLTIGSHNTDRSPDFRTVTKGIAGIVKITIPRTFCKA